MLKPWWSPYLDRQSCCLLAELPAAGQSWPAEAAWGEGGQCLPRTSADLAVFPCMGTAVCPVTASHWDVWCSTANHLWGWLAVSHQPVCGCRLLQDILFISAEVLCWGGVNDLFRNLAGTPGCPPCAVPCSSVALVVPMGTNGASSPCPPFCTSFLLPPHLGALLSLAGFPGLCLRVWGAAGPLLSTLLLFVVSQLLVFPLINIQ